MKVFVNRSTKMFAAISVRLNEPAPGVLDNLAAMLILAVSLSVYAELTMFPPPAGPDICCNNNSGSVGLTSVLSRRCRHVAKCSWLGRYLH